MVFGALGRGPGGTKHGKLTSRELKLTRETSKPKAFKHRVEGKGFRVGFRVLGLRVEGTLIQKAPKILNAANLVVPFSIV